jgi:hypothetical protein
LPCLRVRPSPRLGRIRKYGNAGIVMRFFLLNSPLQRRPMIQKLIILNSFITSSTNYVIIFCLISKRSQFCR